MELIDLMSLWLGRILIYCGLIVLSTFVFSFTIARVFYFFNDLKIIMEFAVWRKKKRASLSKKDESRFQELVRSEALGNISEIELNELDALQEKRRCFAGKA